MQSDAQGCAADDRGATISHSACPRHPSLYRNHCSYFYTCTR